MSIHKAARYKDISFGDFIEARDVVINQEIFNRQLYLIYDTTIHAHNILRSPLPDSFYRLPSFKHTIAATDRIDNLAYKYYGDPDAYWCIAEFNRLLDPMDLSSLDTLDIPYKSYLFNLLIQLRFES